MTKRFNQDKTVVKNLGDLLRDTLLSVKREGKRNKSLREKWKIVAGEKISGHTEVRLVKDGILYIDVDSATWLHHLSSFKREELLRSMRSEFKKGYISDIKFRIGTTF